MGRVKIAPTPRAAALNDAMRRAATQISPPTAESLKNGLASANKATKPAGRNSLPTPRGSQDRATSEPAGKRKAATDSKTATKDTKLALRSSDKSSAAASSTPVAVDNMLDMPADSPPSKRQRVGDASPARRRSTRGKAAKEDTVPPPTKSRRSAGRKQEVPSSTASEVDDATLTPLPDEQDYAVSVSADQVESSKEHSLNDEAVADGPDSLPSPTSAASDTQAMVTQSEDGPPLRETMSLPPPSGLASNEAGPKQADPDMAGIQMEPASTGSPSGMSIGPVPDVPSLEHYGIPPPGSWVQTPTGLVQVSGTGAIAENDQQPQGLIPMQGASGPASVHPLQHIFPHLAPPVGANGMPLQITPNRRGQKVKGRPPPKNPPAPKSRTSVPTAQRPAPNGNNADTNDGAQANAHHQIRKQPFKSIIEFPNYPPPNAEIPDHYSMWDIAQFMPNSLRESNLRPFIQREWSANELCACLRDDARAILNARQGKDKTMVFQKRMERIKKDLVARGEYEALLQAPPLRQDGRPTWVKRGNVRRK